MSDTTLMSDATATNDGNPASSPAENATLIAATATTTAADPATQQQATDGQTASDPQAAGEDPATQTDNKPVLRAPEKYEFKTPEGALVDDKVVGQLGDVARELDLPQEDAQKLLDRMAPVIQAQQTEAIQAVRTQWFEAAVVDKEFGGDKLNENLATAKKALDQFGSPELRTLLNDSGLGNHPEIIRAFYRAGLAISEDGFVPASRPAKPTGPRDAATALYPNQQRS